MSHFTTPKGTSLPILDLRGKDYLEVKYRLVWFREEHPMWSIETEFVSTTDKSSTAKATIRDESGRVIATSHKFENAQGFPDFLEKSETGAIGRALALIGYGTQFCADELDEGKRIVDAPTARKGSLAGKLEQPGPSDGVTPTDYRITFGKFNGKSIEQVYNEKGADTLWDYVEYLESTAEKNKKPLSQTASDFIAHVKEFMRVVDGVVLS